MRSSSNSRFLSNTSLSLPSRSVRLIGVSEIMIVIEMCHRKQLPDAQLIITCACWLSENARLKLRTSFARVPLAAALFRLITAGMGRRELPRLVSDPDAQLGCLGCRWCDTEQLLRPTAVYCIKGCPHDGTLSNTHRCRLAGLFLIMESYKCVRGVVNALTN